MMGLLKQFLQRKNPKHGHAQNNNDNNRQTLRERELPWVLLPTPESTQG